MRKCADLKSLLNGFLFFLTPKCGVGQNSLQKNHKKLGGDEGETAFGEYSLIIGQSGDIFTV